MFSRTIRTHKMYIKPFCSTKEKYEIGENTFWLSICGMIFCFMFSYMSLSFYHDTMFITSNKITNNKHKQSNNITKKNDQQDQLNQIKNDCSKYFDTKNV